MYLNTGSTLIFIETVKIIGKTLKISNSSVTLEYYYKDNEDAQLAFDIVFTELNGGRHTLDCCALPEPITQNYENR